MAEVMPALTPRLYDLQVNTAEWATQMGPNTEESLRLADDPFPLAGVGLVPTNLGGKPAGSRLDEGLPYHSRAAACLPVG